MSAKELALASIRKHVWSGFYDPDTAFVAVVGEMEGNGRINEDWLDLELEKEWAKKAAEEADWENPTDCDRLDEVFAELWQKDIIALQNVGRAQPYGRAEVYGCWIELGEDESPMEGYCFFHQQDLERVMRGEGLLLSFGDLRDDERKGVQIGKIVCEVLRRHGLVVEWDGTIEARIFLPAFCWKKRSLSFLKYNAIVDQHCVALRKSLKTPMEKLGEMGMAAPSGCLLLGKPGARLFVGYLGILLDIFATQSLHQRLIMKEVRDSVPASMAASLLVIGAFLLQYALRLWGKWLYLAAFLAVPVIFLIVLGGLR